MIIAYDKSADDFGNNGLGPLNPISCTVSETLGGMWELTLDHAIDGTKSARLAMGNIIKAPVPSGTTPAIDTPGQTIRVYRISTDGRRLYLRAEPSQSAKGLATYKNGSEVTALDWTTHANWYEVTTPDGKRGYMYAGNLVFVREESAGEPEHVAAKELRDQLFRIYKIVPGIDIITVYARHIFYDLADNLLDEYAPENVSGAIAANGILTHCRGAGHGFTMRSNLTEMGSADWTNKRPTDAMLGSGGLTETWHAEIARDWYDVYAVERVGRETDVVIRQGKQLKSLGGEINTSDVATRLIPIGRDRQNNKLYLPEVYIDSELIDDYPVIKWGVLDVPDAKVGGSITTDAAYQMMRDAVQAEWDGKRDKPSTTLDVGFVDTSQTAEYAAYGDSYNLAIGDSVRVICPNVGIDTTMRVTEYEFDCLKKAYTYLGLGDVAATIAKEGQR